MANVMRRGVDCDGLISKAFSAFSNQTTETKEQVGNIVNFQNFKTNQIIHKQTQNTKNATAKVLKFSN